MLILKGRPPNFAQIEAVFGKAVHQPGVLFTYGDAIFNPDAVQIPKPLLCHEHVHSLRQGKDPDTWWERYLKDRDFRFNEELLAHKIEYRVYCQEWWEGKNRAGRRAGLKIMATRLSSAIYGNMCRFEDAKRLIKRMDNLGASFELGAFVQGMQESACCP